jgi:nucleoside-diphosphate-sugar epimerase
MGQRSLDKKNMGICVVTGASGFVGSHLIDYLLAVGADIICPVRNIRNLRHLTNKNITITTFEGLEKEIGLKGNLDYFFHVAGATRALSYKDYYSANVELTERLLQLILRKADFKYFKRFVFISSQAVNGPAPNSVTPVTESDAPNPVSWYGRSKLEAERIVQKYSDKIPGVIIRPSTVFGPRDTDVLGVFKSCKYHLAPCLTGKDRMVSVIYVEDLIHGVIEAALSHKTVGKTYFLTNQEPVVWRDFIREVGRLMKSSVVILPIPKIVLKPFGFISDLLGKVTGTPSLFRTEKIREMDQWFWICSPESAYRDFGWVAQNELSRSLTNTYLWYKAQGWL